MKKAPDMYRTQEPEAAINEMAKRHSHVIVNNARVCENRIPLRLDMIEEFTWIHKGWTAVGRQHYENWQKHGGILIDYTAALGFQIDARRKYGKKMECGGYFFVECPASLSFIESWALNATDEIVIHEPPNWNNHSKTVDDRVPSPERVLAMHDVLADRLMMPRSDREKAIARITNIKHDSYMVMSSDEISQLSGLNTLAAVRTFENLRQHMTGFQFDTIYPITLRVRPTQPAMQELYDHIEGYPASEKGERFMKRWQLAKCTRKWQGILKRICVEGYAEKKKNLHAIVFRPDRRPLVHSLGKRFRTANTELQAMIQFVESLPDYLDHCRQFPRLALPEHCEDVVLERDTTD